MSDLHYFNNFKAQNSIFVRGSGSTNNDNNLHYFTYLY